MRKLSTRAILLVFVQPIVLVLAFSLLYRLFQLDPKGHPSFLDYLSSLTVMAMCFPFMVWNLKELARTFAKKRCASSAQRASAMDNGDQHPPGLAEYLLSFLPTMQRDPVMGDLEELYRFKYIQQGRTEARRWYCRQVALAFGSLLGRLINRSVFGWLARLARYM